MLGIVGLGRLGAGGIAWTGVRFSGSGGGTGGGE